MYFHKEKLSQGIVVYTHKGILMLKEFSPSKITLLTKLRIDAKK